MTSKHVVVVGAGIVGVSTAVWLRRGGAAVTLIDRDGPAAGTSYGNAGVLASASIVPVTTPGLIAKAPRMLFDRDGPLFLKWRYLPRLLPWLRRYLAHANADDCRRIAAALVPIIGDSVEQHQALAAGTSAARHIAPSDYVFAYRDRAAFEADAFSWNLRRAADFVPELIEGAGPVSDYEPLLAASTGLVARVPDHGFIRDPGGYVKDLAAHFAEIGGDIMRAEVVDVVLRDGRAAGVATRGGGVVACDAVALAAGVWSRPIAEKLGVVVPMESERGYHLMLKDASAAPRHPTMVAAGKFVATPMAAGVRIAGLVELGGLDAAPSAAPFAFLRRQARAAFAGLDWSVEETWMGHRPAPADSLPFLGEVKAAPGVWLGFGHHHVGLTGGPKTGRLIADLILGRKPNIDLAPYRPERFT